MDLGDALDSERVESRLYPRCALVTQKTHRTARYGLYGYFLAGLLGSRDGRETAVAADGVRS